MSVIEAVLERELSAVLAQPGTLPAPHTYELVVDTVGHVPGAAWSWTGPTAEPGTSWPWDELPDEDKDPAPDAAAAPEPSSERDDAWARPGAEGPADSEHLSPAVEQVRAAVQSLAAAEVSGRTADVAALLTMSEQLRGLTLRAVAEMDATGSHLPTGAATAAVFVRETLTISDVTARAKVRLATGLRDDVPQVEQLLSSGGGTTVEHAAAVVAGTRGLDPQVVRDSQDAICTLLASADPQTVREQLRERAEALNPELGRDAERRAHSRRGVTADTVPNGLVLGGSYGVKQGHEFLLGLDLAVEAERTDGDTRSLRQRRADALLAWARKAAAEHGAPAGSVAEDLRTTRTSLIVTCTAEQLAEARRLLDRLGQAPPATPAAGSAEDVAGPAWPWGTGDSGPGDPGSRIPAGASFGPGALVSSAVLQRLTCDAAVSLAVVPEQEPGDNPIGLRPDHAQQRPDPLYVGRAARIVTAAQWRALVVRDRHCVVTGCRRRPVECQAHHVRHWLIGGLTDLPNLVLLCHQHHHDHHDRGHDLRHRDGRWMTSTGWAANAPP